MRSTSCTVFDRQGISITWAKAFWRLAMPVGSFAMATNVDLVVLGSRGRDVAAAAGFLPCCACGKSRQAKPSKGCVLVEIIATCTGGKRRVHSGFGVGGACKELATLGKWDGSRLDEIRRSN